MSAVAPARKLLAPLTPAYRVALWLREMRLKTGLESVHRLRFPVVSIGNLSTGGTGKTPLTIALAKALSKRGLHVDVLSRGYGRKDTHAAHVDPQGTAEQFGDEPLLIARQAGIPVYVAQQRYDAGLLAEAQITGTSEGDAKAIVHLLDDGFQHRQLARNVDIVLLNREDWHDRLLPSGNLREPLKAISRARIIALTTEAAEIEDDLRGVGWKGTIWRLHRSMIVPNIEAPASAFCGIARPAQFFSGLETNGVQLTARKAFPDHHSYTANDIQQLAAKARATGAGTLLTTEKDLVRLGPLANPLAEKMPIHAVALRTEIANEDKAIDALQAELEPSIRGR